MTSTQLVIPNRGRGLSPQLEVPAAGVLVPACLAAALPVARSAAVRAYPQAVEACRDPPCSLAAWADAVASECQGAARSQRGAEVVLPGVAR